MPQNYAIIVAAGSGTRMQTSTPKQFLDINGWPVLMHTISRFVQFDKHIKIILVLNKEYISFWKSLCQKHNFNLAHEITEGGSSRFHSVKNGLALINKEGLVAVHDAVRPLVSVKTIADCFEMAKKEGAVIPVTDVPYSIRKTYKNQTVSVPRDEYFLVHTPQVFKTDILLKAYNTKQADFTDDASVAEAAGYTIHAVLSNPENIKITTPVDFALAGLLLKTNAGLDL